MKKDNRPDQLPRQRVASALSSAIETVEKALKTLEDTDSPAHSNDEAWYLLDDIEQLLRKMRSRLLPPQKR